LRISSDTNFTTNPKLLLYDTVRKEIAYSTNTTLQGKTFIIDNPIYENKYLVHACLEGPEMGIYYRGKGEIVNNEYVIIDLPYYVDKIGYDFTIQITSIYDKNRKIQNIYSTSEVENNKFFVYGNDGKFYWTVFGSRSDIIVDPYKSDVEVKGNGPYKWI
jgi:hypothetical protein